MATYLLVDTMNTSPRHVVSGDVSEKVGMAIHITLNAINKCYKKFNADHVVFALEGRSWRKDFHLIKRTPSDKRAALTPKEVEEDTAFFEAYDDFLKFMTERTNCSTIKCDIAEADDIIARSFRSIL